MRSIVWRGVVVPGTRRPQILAMVEPAGPIERLIPPVAEADLRALALLLVDAVESGAAVGFLAPLDLEAAQRWWHGVLATARPGAVVLVARDAAGIAGTVQLHPAWAPNQPHRAEVAKLLVHRRARGTGLGTRLMLEAGRWRGRRRSADRSSAPVERPRDAQLFGARWPIPALAARRRPMT